MGDRRFWLGFATMAALGVVLGGAVVGWIALLRITALEMRIGCMHGVPGRPVMWVCQAQSAQPALTTTSTTTTTLPPP